MGGVTVPESLPQRVRRLREARGLSQRQLAQMLGMSHQQLNKLETSEHRTLQRRTLQRFAAVFDVSPEYLATGVELDASGLPDLAEYLRARHTLSEEDMAAVVRIVHALESAGASRLQDTELLAAYDRPELDDTMRREVDAWGE
jgi:transcriptional regulator with XRE-family HTH domain